MSKKFRSWTELVKLHADIEAGKLTDAAFAIDLGAIAAGDPNVAVVNRDPEAFFRATYLTVDLRRLLKEVLESLAGKQGYNRVLKLRTAFGGGKSHTLAALLHAARHPEVLEHIPEARGFERPREVAVAVFDGEKFDARNGKELEDGRIICTMWGWIAWQIDAERAFAIVKDHDQDCVAPGGDVIRKMLNVGASRRPVLILLDEVLKYLERAAAVQVHDSTLERQAKDFFQNLTVEVAGSSNAVLVYSLTWSAREALGNISLLEEINKLAARVDQLCEPVSGDEILPVLKRRLLGAEPAVTVANEVATAYQEAVTSLQRAYAETEALRRQAEERGQQLRERIRAAYPFHPALIDIFRERWAAIDAFQRTRGALRFLASCLYSLKKSGNAGPLVGPSDIPLSDRDVRVKMLNELGVQNAFDAVIEADIEGRNSRARRIDERLASENPSLASIKPATRLATAILLYSFGGLSRKEGSDETLPPGVTENELLEACVSPDIDSLTARAVLSELRNTCLYLHYDGIRYCFKKDPNVTKLIEDAEQQIARQEIEASGRGQVYHKIKQMLEAKLAGQTAAVIWPEKSKDIPDGEPLFLIAYLPPEFAKLTQSEQEKQAKEYFTKYEDRPRRYRNGLGLGIPDKKQIEELQQAVRYLLAIEKVEQAKQQFNLTKEHLEQLKERRRAKETAVESCFRELYTAVWLPSFKDGELGIERVERVGRPLQAVGIHERIMEMLISLGTPRIHEYIVPRKIAERVKLGEGQNLGVEVSAVVESFFRDLTPPRVTSKKILLEAIAKGIGEGTFGYSSSKPAALGEDGKFQISREKVVFGRPIPASEIDLDTGFLIAPSAISTTSQPQVEEAPSRPSDKIEVKVLSTDKPVDVGSSRAESSAKKSSIRLKFKATREQIFKAFPAIANLADNADDGKVMFLIEGFSLAGFDESWLRNAVKEPLEEAEIELLD